MLSLAPPYFQIDGMTVLGDADDPLQYYYYPNRPRLSVDEQGRPAIRFIILKEAQDEIDAGVDGADEEDVAGFLVFDTDLRWEESAIRKAAREIERELNLPDTPRLAPLPYRDGTVELTFLDRKTQLPADPGDGGAGPGDDGGTPAPEFDPAQRWVPFLSTSGVPSLYGDNHAIFSAMLTRQATKLMYGAFEGFMPAGVVYTLEFVAMAPAYRVTVEADWSQAYQFIQDTWDVNLVFFDLRFDEIRERLETAQIIKIEASLELEGEEAAVVEEEFRQVRRELEDFLMETFFKPEPNADRVEPDEPDTLDDVVRASRSLHALAHHWPTGGYSRREVDIATLRTLSIDYSTRRAVRRRIAPQAHISLFFEDFGLTRDDIVTVVDGNDALWNTTDFDASLNAEFATEGIDSVTLDVQYRKAEAFDPLADPDAEWSFKFDTGEERFTRSAWYNPDIGHSYFYRFGINFKPSALPGPRHTLNSGWRPHDSQLLVVSPDDLYRRHRTEVRLIDKFPFDRYPQVFVRLHYAHDGWIHEDSELLSADRKSMPFAFRTARDADVAVDYRLTYFKVGGGTLEGPWQRDAGDLIVVPDPLPPQPVIRLAIAGDRSRIANLIVDFRYIDEENGIFAGDSIFIDQTNINAQHLWRLPAIDPEKRRYEYSQTLIDIDGNVIMTGFQQEERTTLVVGDKSVRQMEVQPEIVGPPFAENRVERLLLTLRYRDPANGIDIEEQRVFAQPGVGLPWKVGLQDAAARDYTWEATYVLTTGFERTTGEMAARDRFLLISSVPPAA